MKEFIFDVLVFAVTFILQSILSQIITIDSLLTDFVSVIVIYLIVYFIGRKLLKR